MEHGFFEDAEVTASDTHLDLYRMHQPDPEPPIEETLGALTITCAILGARRPEQLDLSLPGAALQLAA